MRVEVHIKNGRTIFRFAKRGIDAIARNQEKDFEGGRIVVDIKHNLDQPNWEKASVRSINPSAIAFVLEAPRPNSDDNEGIGAA